MDSEKDEIIDKFKVKSDNIIVKKKAIISWMKSVLAKQNYSNNLTSLSDDFLEQFHNGIILCNIMNIINNNCISKIKTENSVFASIENLNSFINACKEYGINSVNDLNPYNFIMESKNTEEKFIEIIKDICYTSNDKGFVVPEFDIVKFKEDMEIEKKEMQDSSKVKRLSKNYMNNGSPVISQSFRDFSSSSINYSSLGGSHFKENSQLSTGSLKPPVIYENGPNSAPVSSESPNDFILKINSKIENIENNQSKLYSMINEINKKMDKIEVLSNFQNKHIEKLASNTLNGLDIMNQQLETIQNKLEKSAFPSISPVQTLLRGNSVGFINTNNLQNSSSTSSINTQGERRKQSIFGLPSLSKSGQSSSKLKFGHRNHDNPNGKSSLNPSQNPVVTSSTPDLTNSENFNSTPQLQFSTLPENILQMNLSRQENMRLSVIYELFATESDYVRDLNVIINCLMDSISKSQLLSDKEFNGLFSNVKDLVVVNQEFNDNLTALKEADPVIPEIGNEFIKISEKLKVYKEYCSNYPLALSLLRELSQRPEVKNLLVKLAENSECRGLSLESFLIKPVQRICKYPLMIRELLKYTSKDAKDYPVLENSLTVIENVIAYVNEGTKALEEKERLTALQSRIECETYDIKLKLSLADKHMIKEGNIQRLINNKPKDRHIFLFNDLILICKDWTSSYKYKYQLEEYLPISSIILKNEVTEKLPKGHLYVFQIIPQGTKNKAEMMQGGNSSQPITLSVINEDQKKEWTQSIWDAITESKKIVREVVTDDDIDDIDKDINNDIKINIVRKREEYPMLVEINGVKWKRATAATGQNYYYNTVTFDSVWKLPNEYYVIDSETGEKYLHNAETEYDDSKNTEGEESNDEDDNNEEEEYYNSENVEGYPDWKMVKMDNNIVYYFNKNTHETQWEHPGAEGNNITEKKSIQQLQNILISVPAQ